MKLLRCIICEGEVDLLSDDRLIEKKIKCRKCGFTNDHAPREPEVVIIRKRSV